MPRRLVAAIWVGIIALAPAPAWAQSAEQHRTVRPGDRIEWHGLSPHRVQFGGSGGAPSAPLTPLADVGRILAFVPPLAVKRGGVGHSPIGGTPMLVATVKDDAAATGVASFVFTCGHHPGPMKSLPFKIAPRDTQPPRTLKIRVVGLDWMLDTPGGPVKVDEP
jgi:hypothetical protein